MLGLFGTARFAAYGAHGAAGSAGNDWLFGWMYPLIGERGASAAIGTLELATGALLAIWRTIPQRVAGWLGYGHVHLPGLLSFSSGAPKLFEAGYGSAFLGSPGQFLTKDAVLPAACAALFLDGAGEVAGRRIWLARRVGTIAVGSRVRLGCQIADRSLDADRKRPHRA